VTASAPKLQDVLAAFAAGFRTDKGLLGEYLANYPQFSDALVDLTHELELQQALASDAPLDADAEAWLAITTAQLAGLSSAPVDPFASLTSDDYVRVRRSLDIPGAVLNAFRDRVVNVPTVPQTFLRQLADEIHTTFLDLLSHLRGSPRVATASSYKSNQAPQAPSEKISFEQLLIDTGVKPERRVSLMDDDD
jgi:hypothetical protein